MPTTDVEVQRRHVPILKRALAGVILVIAAALAIHVVIGLVMAVFWIIVTIAVVVAVLWALRTLL